MRAVSVMPRTATTITISMRTVEEATDPKRLDEFRPTRSRKDGPTGSTVATVPSMSAPSTIQPVMNPRRGPTARPTQTYCAPQFASHRLRRWNE
jgi:hypothetical protein